MAVASSTVNSFPDAAARELRLGSLDSKESRAVARLDSWAAYSPPGWLLYGREGALFAQRFDEKTARLDGEPFLLADNVGYFLNTASTAFSVSRTGVLAYRTATSPSRVAWFDRHGKEIGQLGQPVRTSGFRISPDASRSGRSNQRSADRLRGYLALRPAEGLDTAPFRHRERVAAGVVPGRATVFYSSDRHTPDI
jgi:hypothetical protein